MNKQEILSSMILELRRGAIVLSALSQLKDPMYGYNLVSVLSENGISVEANTLYPLLRRLEAQGVLESHWETGEAKPRKYYNTTPKGNEIYEELKLRWEELSKSVGNLIGGNNNE